MSHCAFLSIEVPLIILLFKRYFPLNVPPINFLLSWKLCTPIKQNEYFRKDNDKPRVFFPVIWSNLKVLAILKTIFLLAFKHVTSFQKHAGLQTCHFISKTCTQLEDNCNFYIWYVTDTLLHSYLFIQQNESLNNLLFFKA